MNRGKMFLSKRDPSAPPELLNWRLWYGVLCFGLMGAARGIDEGLIGTSIEQISWQRRFNMGEYSTRSAQAEAELLGNITSMVQVRRARKKADVMFWRLTLTRWAQSPERSSPSRS